MNQVLGKINLNGVRDPRVAQPVSDVPPTQRIRTDRLDEFEAYRARMNERILGIDHLGIKRFFNLDTMAYKDGALSAKASA